MDAGAAVRGEGAQHLVLFPDPVMQSSSEDLIEDSFAELDALVAGGMVELAIDDVHVSDRNAGIVEAVVPS